MSNINNSIQEENSLLDQVKSGVVDINDSDVRDNINSQLLRVTARKFLTPYIALEKVSKLLANFHISIAQQNFLEGEMGVIVVPANQFGEMVGMKDDGSVVTKEDSPYSIFFEWQVSDCGMFDVFCNLVTEEELDEILEDIEDEANDEEDEELNEMDYTGFAMDKKAKNEPVFSGNIEDRRSDDAKRDDAAFNARVPDQRTIKKDGLETDPKKFKSEPLPKISDKSTRDMQKEPWLSRDGVIGSRDIGSDPYNRPESLPTYSRTKSWNKISGRGISNPKVNLAHDQKVQGIMKEDNLQELNTKTYQSAKKLAGERLKMIKGAKKDGHKSPVLDRFERTLTASRGRADRLIARNKANKPTVQKEENDNTVVEGNLTNKRKKNEALRKYIESKKPENAVKTKTKAVRNALKGPTVNQFDIRNLKIAEENDYEVIHNGKTTNINAPSSSEAQRKAEKKFGLKPKFKHKGMTIARKTVKEENDYEVIYNGKTTKINAPSSSEAQTKAEKEFGLKPKFKHKGMTIAPKTMKEEELDEGISKMIKNVKRGLKGWPSAGLDPKEANKDRPKDVVRRAKQIAKDDPKMAEKIAKSETGKGSPADLQRRVIQKALTKK